MSYRVEARITVELQALEEVIADDTERSLVLSVGCFLEDRLRELLLNYAGTPVPGREEKLEQPRRPRPVQFHEMIGEARARKLLQGMIGDIETISRIRNVVAHSFAVRSLANSAEAATLCAELEPARDKNEPTATTAAQARPRFDAAARRTVKAIVDEIFEHERRYRDEMRQKRERESQAETHRTG